MFNLSEAPMLTRGLPQKEFMKASDIEEVLRLHTSGDLTSAEAALRIKNLSYEDIGYARIDHARADRQGFPEVIFGQGKTPGQIAGIFEKLIARSPNVLITRTTAEVFGQIRNIHTDAEWHESARLIRLFRDKTELGIGEISVATAGTSDIPVAEEAALTAEAMGNTVQRIWDAGVAGIHRILGERERLQNSRVVIVVAGMEGALPSVIGGLVAVPVIGVPTSVGYGASFGGIAALLGMLNSCASNVTVVNIDNGFGAGFAASLINRKPQ
jgi:pyridinium-3,5-biscarboxylic acid mononucleotide synthase